MSLKKKIYFSPFGYVISLMMNAFKILHQPYMVYGYYNYVQRKFFRNIRISSSACITQKNNLDIGDNVWVNHYARIDASGGVKIGEGCQIGFSSAILSHSSHNAIRLNGKKYIELDIEERLGYIFKSVEIGEYTFIGGGVTILPGVKIGKGCVIGVGAVVNTNIPDYSIAVGIPAKIIGNTLNVDFEFWQNGFVSENYYAKELIRQFETNDPNKHDTFS